MANIRLPMQLLGVRPHSSGRLQPGEEARHHGRVARRCVGRSAQRRSLQGRAICKLNKATNSDLRRREAIRVFSSVPLEQHKGERTRRAHARRSRPAGPAEG